MKEMGVSSILSYRVLQLATITENDEAVVLTRLPKETPQIVEVGVGV